MTFMYLYIGLLLLITVDTLPSCLQNLVPDFIERPLVYSVVDMLENIVSQVNAMTIQWQLVSNQFTFK